MVDPLCIVDGEISKASTELATGGESTEVAEMEAKSDDAPPLPDLTGDPTILEQYSDVLVRYPRHPSRCHLIIFMSNSMAGLGVGWAAITSSLEIVGGHYDRLTLRAESFGKY